VATKSVKSILERCLNKTPPFSIKRHVLCVFGGDNPQTRSLKERLNLIETRPFVRLALVTVRPQGSTLGQYGNIQRDFDIADEIYQEECDAWIYCEGSIVVETNILGANGVIDQIPCPLGEQDDPTAEEDDLFDLGRDLGADVVGYYIAGSTNPNRVGCSAYPEGRRGFWVMFNSARTTLAHELTHVIGGNPHPNQDDEVPDNDSTNVMWPAPGNRTTELRRVQCERIHDDPDVESC
jgi:hypothetical protein